jgi:hypothetical protein
MSLDGLSPEEIENKQNELLAKVPASENIGNGSLRLELGSTWSEDLYWAIRNRLIERGFLETGRGRGGSVKRVAPEIAEPPFGQSETNTSELPNDQLSTSPNYSNESNLYEPIATVLRNQWSKAQGFDNYFVEIPARQGSRLTGGKWTRPDIAVVGYKSFIYIPGRFLEVITFEVKPTYAADVSAVYEALAHRRAATRAYVIVHIPADVKADYKNVIAAIYEESKKFGIGFIVAEDPADFDTWDLALDADRFEPEPKRLNEFIAIQVTTQLKEQIVKWFK